MGYTTKFQGELKFTYEISIPQLKKLESMFGEDCREHPEWNASELYYIDLELTEGYDGIRHNGAEKTYHLDKLINVVLTEMRKRWPEFGLSGQLSAQGEDVEDRWMLGIEEDGMAHQQKVAVGGSRVECPECGHKFILEEKATS